VTIFRPQLPSDREKKPASQPWRSQKTTFKQSFRELISLRKNQLGSSKYPKYCCGEKGTNLSSLPIANRPPNSKLKVQQEGSEWVVGDSF